MAVKDDNCCILSCKCQQGQPLWKGPRQDTIKPLQKTRRMLSSLALVPLLLCTRAAASDLECGCPHTKQTPLQPATIPNLPVILKAVAFCVPPLQDVNDYSVLFSSNLSGREGSEHETGASIPAKSAPPKPRNFDSVIYCAVKDVQRGKPNNRRWLKIVEGVLEGSDTGDVVGIFTRIRLSIMTSIQKLSVNGTVLPHSLILSDPKKNAQLLEGFRIVRRIDGTHHILRSGLFRCEDGLLSMQCDHETCAAMLYSAEGELRSIWFGPSSNSKGYVPLLLVYDQINLHVIEAVLRLFSSIFPKAGELVKSFPHSQIIRLLHQIQSGSLSYARLIRCCHRLGLERYVYCKSSDDSRLAIDLFQSLFSKLPPYLQGLRHPSITAVSTSKCLSCLDFEIVAMSEHLTMKLVTPIIKDAEDLQAALLATLAPVMLSRPCSRCQRAGTLQFCRFQSLRLEKYYLIIELDEALEMTVPSEIVLGELRGTLVSVLAVNKADNQMSFWEPEEGVVTRRPPLEPETAAKETQSDGHDSGPTADMARDDAKRDGRLCPLIVIYGPKEE